MKESVLRTLVPIIYALLVRWGVADYLGLDDPLVQSLASLIGGGVVYVVLRWAETHKAAIGWLLGYPSQPSYGEVPPNPPVEPYADPAKVEHTDGTGV